MVNEVIMSKSWLNRPAFWVAIVFTLLFLLVGVPNFLGAGTGLLHWAVAVIWLLITGGLWYAVVKGASSVEDSAHSLRDQGREIRDRVKDKLD